MSSRIRTFAIGLSALIVSLLAATLFSVSMTHAASNSASWIDGKSFKYTSGSNSATYKSIGTYADLKDESTYEAFVRSGDSLSAGKSCVQSSPSGAMVLSVRSNEIYLTKSGVLNSTVPAGGSAIPDCEYYTDSQKIGVTISGSRPAGGTPESGGLTNDEVSVLLSDCPDLTKIDNVKNKLLGFSKKRADAISVIQSGLKFDGTNLSDKPYDMCASLASYIQNPKWLDGDLTEHLVYTTDEVGAGTTCAVEGVGWIICPVLTFMAKIVDQVYDVVASWLTVSPVTSSNESLYNAWGVMRNIANVCFVICFLVVIYSQITGFGVSNYGIKKILPRIVIAAIFVNISFWVCAIAVDVSNIAGSGAYGLFGSDAFTKGINDSSFSGFSTGDGGGGWIGVTAAILGTAAILYLALPALIIALPAALLAIVAVFIVLALRQVLIILLIVVSPLAFVALLLPNTEKLFKKWRELFQTLLLMYPIISVIFGVSALASSIVMTSAKEADGDGSKLTIQLMGALITILPLAITPVIMKSAGGVLNRVGAFVNNPNRGPVDALRKRAEGVAGRMRNNRDMRALATGADGSYNRRGFSFRRAGIRGDQKNKNVQRQRDAVVDQFAHSDSKLEQSLKRAVHAEESAAEIKEATIANAKLERLELPGDAGNAVQQQRQRAFNATRNLQNVEKTEENNFDAEHNLSNPDQYDALNRSKDRSQNAQLINDTRYAGSDIGRSMAQTRKTTEGQLNQYKLEQDRTYAQSDIGQRQAETKLATQGEIDIQHDLDKLSFSSSGVGRTQAQDKRVVTGEQKKVDSKAELTFEQSNTGERLAIENQAIEDQVGAAKAETGAIVSELRASPEAAAETIAELQTKHGVSFDSVAEDLTNADRVNRVQTQRSAAAKRVADVEYAQDIQDDSTGLATKAGGIQGIAGVSQAKAVATQTILKSFKEGVAAESTLLSEVKEGVLLGDERDPKTGELRTVNLSNPDILDQPDEVISAIGSTIAGRKHMQSHIKLWNRASELRREAESSVAQTVEGTPERVAAEKRLEKAKNLQQVVMADKSKTPFGIGDQAQGDAVVGDYKGDILEETRGRILSNLSPEAMAGLDPDDVRLMYEMGRAGKLGPEHVAKIKDSYVKWQKNPNISGRLKDKVRVLVDPIITGDYSAGPAGARFPEVQTMSNA